MSVITDLIDENSECHRRIAELEARIVWLECEAKVNAAPVVSAEQQGVADSVLVEALEAMLEECDPMKLNCGEPWCRARAAIAAAKAVKS